MNLRWLLLDHVPPGIALTDRQRSDLARRAKTMRFERLSTRRENIQRTLVVCAASIVAPACMFFILHALLPTATARCPECGEAVAGDPLHAEINS